jgi:hypothetical protein
MNQCNEPDHGAINAERAESRGLLKRSDAAEIISTHPNDLLGWPKGRRTGKVPKAKMQELERELAAVTEQRDRLAEALNRIANNNVQDLPGTDYAYALGRMEGIAKIALAAVKGGSYE